MNVPNPYESSRSPVLALGEPGPSTLGIARGFLIVVLAGALGSLLGLIAGALLGTLVPDYYRAVFDNPNLNPVQVGTGLGVIQGFGIGIVVGCVVLLAVAIAHRRSHSFARV